MTKRLFILRPVRGRQNGERVSTQLLGKRRHNLTHYRETENWNGGVVSGMGEGKTVGDGCLGSEKQTQRKWN